MAVQTSVSPVVLRGVLDVRTADARTKKCRAVFACEPHYRRLRGRIQVKILPIVRHRALERAIDRILGQVQLLATHSSWTRR
jgi:hypothetical protein